MHRTIFSSIPGLFPLDPSSTSQDVTIKTSPCIAKFPWGEESAKALKTTALNRSHSREPEGASARKKGNYFKIPTRSQILCQVLSRHLITAKDSLRQESLLSL